MAIPNSKTLNQSVSHRFSLWFSDSSLKIFILLAKGVLVFDSVTFDPAFIPRCSSNESLTQSGTNPPSYPNPINSLRTM